MYVGRILITFFLSVLYAILHYIRVTISAILVDPMMTRALQSVPGKV